MNWLTRHAAAIQSGGAIATVAIALAALIGVKYQLDTSEHIQRSQSARDAYRSHLALAAANPQFAEPADACQLMKGQASGAYFAFVEHLLYSAEQMLSVESGWEATFEQALEPHTALLCALPDHPAGNPEMNALTTRFRKQNCPQQPPCN